MVAVRPPARPNDASGESFRLQMGALPQSQPIRRRRISPEDLSVEWDHKVMGEGCAAVREAWACVCNYALYVVEMRDEFLAGQPTDLPKISWCLQVPGDEELEPFVGGPAPTYEDAMARAEIAVRVQLGIAMDG